MKAKIPNLLTIIRIISTPILIVLGFTKQFYAMVIVAIVASCTDFLDGYLARKWNVTSLKGAKLDAIADKVFAIALVGCLMKEEKLLIISFVLEVLIGGTNLYYHLHNKKVSSLMIGKIKTCSLFITVIFGIVSIFYHPAHCIFQGLIYTTIHLQILCLIYYATDYLHPKHKPSIEDNPMHHEIMKEEATEEETKLEQTIVLENLEKLTEKKH